MVHGSLPLEVLGTSHTWAIEGGGWGVQGWPGLHVPVSKIMGEKKMKRKEEKKLEGVGEKEKGLVALSIVPTLGQEGQHVF